MDAWERQAGEPNLWYGRFEVFRLLGVGRSLDGAYRAEEQGSGGAEEQGRGGKGERGREAKGSKGKHKKRPSRHWYAVAERWRWRERAQAWDAAERERVRGEYEAERERSRAERLRRAGLLQAVGEVGLGQAEVEKLTPAEARAMLGTLRMMVVDGMKQERLEYGESTEIVETAQQGELSRRVDEAVARVYGP